MVAKGSMKVRVAYGGKVACDKMVENFQWKMLGITFKDDMFLMPLGSCDIVIGVQ